MREEHGEPLISVVITARNAAATLASTLRALAVQELDARYEVIVVDNGSTDETARIAESGAPLVRLVTREPGGPPGPGAGRNAGVAEARGRWIAFTDGDCIPDPAWLSEGLKALSRADLVQGAVAPDPSGSMMPFDHTVWVQGQSDLFETANLFVSKLAFEGVGGFEDISETGAERPFGEDAWLGWRLVRAGATFEYCPDALVHHEIISRGARGFIAERSRRQRFPELVAKIPELRRRLFMRYFLSSRTFAFDLAVAACIAGLLTGAWLVAVAAAPYLFLLGQGVIGWRRWAPMVLIAHLAADSVSLGALLIGSAKARTVVL